MAVEQSRTELANRALALAGVTRRIDDLDDDATPAGVALRAAFWPVWDAYLQQYPWNWAGGRRAIPALAEAPAFEYARAYPVPDDFLSFRDIFDEPDADFSLESLDDGTLVILTDLPSPLRLRYGRRIRAIGRAPQVWVEAFIPRLLHAAAMAITNIDVDPANAWRMHLELDRAATRWDATTNRAGEVAEGRWLEARRA